MSSPQPALNRRTLLGSAGLAAGAAAVSPLLSSCSAPSTTVANSSPAASLAPTPSSPVTLNILDVAGNLALTKPAIEAFASANPHIVSGITYTTGTAPVDYTYGEGDTDTYHPDVTDINLLYWTVGSATAAWDIIGYTEDHVGTVRLQEFTLADQTATNTLDFIDDLVLVDVTIDGSPVTSG